MDLQTTNADDLVRSRDPRLNEDLHLAVRAAAAERAAGSALERFLGAASGSTRPIVVGPWCSEVGFETLYWVPFVEWALRTHGIEPARVTAISRGGVSSWYEAVCGRYVDVFDVSTLDEFRSRNASRWQRRGGQKQDAVSAWDREILRRAVGRREARRALLLHPHVMYGLFGRFWKGGMPLAQVLARLHHRRWQAPQPELELPESFVAARFYFSEPFPDTAANRALVGAILGALAERTHVVLLHTGLAVDDHAEAGGGSNDRVVSPLAGAAPTRNLHVQTAILGRASAFVGTYGGFSYLAAALGTSGVSFASEAGRFFPSHLDVARRAAVAAGAPFSLVDTTSGAALGLLAAPAQSVAA